MGNEPTERSFSLHSPRSTSVTLVSWSSLASNNVERLCEVGDGRRMKWRRKETKWTKERHNRSEGRERPYAHVGFISLAFLSPTFHLLSYPHKWTRSWGSGCGTVRGNEFAVTFTQLRSFSHINSFIKRVCWVKWLERNKRAEQETGKDWWKGVDSHGSFTLILFVHFAPCDSFSSSSSLLSFTFAPSLKIIRQWTNINITPAMRMNTKSWKSTGMN